MKKHIFLITTAILLSANNFAQYLLKEEQFSVSFPFEPTREVQDIETEGAGTVQMITYIYEDEYTAWMLAYSEYPEDFIKENGMIENAKNGFVQSLSLEIVNEWDVSLDVYHGVYFQAENEESYCVVKDYIVNNRLYQIGILQKDDYPSPEVIDQFINSFNLVISRSDQ